MAYLAPLPILWFADSQSLGVSTGTDFWSDQSAKFACMKADSEIFLQWRGVDEVLEPWKSGRISTLGDIGLGFRAIM
jgi:hypothetical protein